MEIYRRKVWNRILAFAVVDLLGSVIYISGFLGVFDRFLPSNDAYSNFMIDFIGGFQAGIYVSLIVISVYSIVKLICAVKNEDKLKALYIDETDERKRLIFDKAGKKLFEIYYHFMLIASLVAGYFSIAVFFTILSCLFIIAIIYNVLYYYYKHIM